MQDNSDEKRLERLRQDKRNTFRLILENQAAERAAIARSAENVMAHFDARIEGLKVALRESLGLKV